jgi:hypothetical protein
VYHRRARSTGTLVSVYKGAEAHLDTDAGNNPWSTVCEDHSEVCSHRTRALALAHAPHPLTWCAGCQAAARIRGLVGQRVQVLAWGSDEALRADWVPEGTQGTVVAVDDDVSVIHVRWDSGPELGLIIDHDFWKPVAP